MKYKYRVVAIETGGFVPQQYLPWLLLADRWVGLDGEGRISGGNSVFVKKEDAQNAINKAKDINGEWYPEWL